MIKANELRIGNWVVNNKGRLSIIKDISEGINGTVRVIDTQHYNNDVLFGFGCSEINGIPLDENLIIKIGFEKLGREEVATRDMTTGELTNQEVFGKQIANNFSLYTVDDFSDWWIAYQWRDDFPRQLFWSKPKFVHELQNLFFFLSGEEISL